MLTALFVSLGLWQVGRGQAKQALQDAFSSQAPAAPVTLRLDTPAPDRLTTLRVEASGSFDAGRQLLLDNQTRDGIPGYHVWTPVPLEGGWVIVDRGWVPANADRRVMPAIDVSSQARRISGYWRPLPQAGLRLDTEPCHAQGFPRVVSYPSQEQLSCILGGKLAAGVLLLDPSEPDGFVRAWTMPNPVPPARHYAYAAQWFAFAATLLFLFVKLNFKSGRRTS
ncbi:MAG: SURF1 family protein [Panacagrimonas sp.]